MLVAWTAHSTSLHETHEGIAEHSKQIYHFSAFNIKLPSAICIIVTYL